MSEDGRKWNWWSTLGVPVLARVLAGIILLALPFVFPAVRSFVSGVFGAIPATLYWILGLCAAAAVGIVAGPRVERARRRGRRVTRADAEALVQKSNYWSKVQRRAELYQIRGEIDYEIYGIEREPDAWQMQAWEIKPPRHTPNVDSALQYFWDDNPTASDGDWYDLDTLLDWLEDQAHDVELPNI